MKRKTQQRSAISRVLSDVDRPMTPQEIQEVASAHKPGLGIATVYRTLKDLIDEGEVVPVEVPGQPPHYEAAGKKHHHHFHCRTCGRVFEVEGCPEGIKSMTPNGFMLEGHHITLHGVCGDCARAQSSGGRSASRR